MSVGLSAANVHDASKEIKTVLYSIPKQGYTEEAERLLIQVDTDEILLTGWGFFSVTKKFLLSVMDKNNTDKTKMFSRISFRNI